MAAFTTLVTGLTTTSTRVHRGRVYPVDTVPALSVFQGADEPVDDDSQSWPVMDSVLTVYVDAHVRQTSTTEGTLNQIRKELTVALMADWTLGLAFVHRVIEGPANEPERGPDAEKPTQVMRTEWRVHYRRNALDPSS